jgi:hypothetical protein
LHPGWLGDPRVKADRSTLLLITGTDKSERLNPGHFAPHGLCQDQGRTCLALLLDCLVGKKLAAPPPTTNLHFLYKCTIYRSIHVRFGHKGFYRDNVLIIDFLFSHKK